ncbi:MAG: hypothetical protein D6723_18585 [Acidobacteria bacterium]|nr:MAG: hypothetical protein D6723_18585 [Acidobacteriota bacterium]
MRETITPWPCQDRASTLTGSREAVTWCGRGTRLGDRWHSAWSRPYNPLKAGFIQQTRAETGGLMMRIQYIIQALILLGLLLPSLPAQSSIGIGQTQRGSLTDTDKRLKSDGSPYDWYQFRGRSGQRISVELSSKSFDGHLVLMDRDGTEIMSSCGTREGRPARIKITLPYTGIYHIRVNSLYKEGRGPYTLKIKLVDSASRAKGEVG